MALRCFQKKKRLPVKPVICAGIIFLIIIVIIRCIGPEDGEIKISGDTKRIRLYDHLACKVIELGLEEYVAGVVAGEMPASFPSEALKAQAVAARTYAAKRLLVPDPRVKAMSQDADISSDPAVNQAWISDAEMKKRWGQWNYAANRKKIIEAVEATRGIVSVYGGQLIDPSYHASCGGNGTENSGDVWKYQIPYLQRVQCNNHPDANHDAVVAMSIDNLARLMEVDAEAVPASKLLGYTKGLQVKEKTPSGRIKELTFGGKTFTGAELRSRVGLKSTLADWKIEGNTVKFITRGYGHGVGMCQHGAGAFARAGWSYGQILSHYYRGTTLANIK